MEASDSTPALLQPRSRIRGRLRVPGDKSISHRALLFGALGQGVSRVRGLARGGDLDSTRAGLSVLGIAIEESGVETLIHGRGWSGWHRPGRLDPVGLDCGNSGTTARLLLGLLAGGIGRFLLLGDASLCRRPMGRVIQPLLSMGAQIGGRERLPLQVEGRALKGQALRTEVPSAQVKSALILAALQACGESSISEPVPTRDHTERMLREMGAPLELQESGAIEVQGGWQPLRPLDMEIPGDLSSAAFFTALAVLLPDSRLEVEQVGLNPRRLGFFRLLRRMGARLDWTVEQDRPEPWGRLRAESSSLQAIHVGPQDVADCIDELPLLAVVAAAAQGTTTICGAAELRVKESDRIRSTRALLQVVGARVEEQTDGLTIEGPTVFKPALIEARGDHRMAMCAAVAAALAPEPSRLVGKEWVDISYPGFFGELERLTR